MLVGKNVWEAETRDEVITARDALGNMMGMFPGNFLKDTTPERIYRCLIAAAAVVHQENVKVRVYSDDEERSLCIASIGGEVAVMGNLLAAGITFRVMKAHPPTNLNNPMVTLAAWLIVVDL